MTKEFIKGLRNIHLDPHGKGRRVFNNDTLTTTIAIRGGNPDKPQQVVGRRRVGNMAGESIDEFPPIDPKTGEPVEAFQLTLPKPRRKRGSG